ncbi:hypothetical protein [Frigoriglobus tundricola]|uniref:Uncharacterized protein n=1 Tax=Frigoriglobus tundricola TaxID=2774151 RepID=A0A6M5YTD1_9BACT|nr:hypothetical protein [Frigoriglobus tundricola]QJW97347.1 hypothetical protein FTUN_4918 [Frigoriglobus tundricola]
MATPTFEDVDKHIQAADLTAIQPAGGAARAIALPDICPAYKIVRPILVLLSNTPIIPQKWRDAIKAFIGVLDLICP